MLTVLCPVYNEAEHIENVLRFFSSAKPEEKELLVIDGGSSDGTREIVAKWAGGHNNIRLIDNPQKFVPFALNLGIRNSTGDPIVRIDAHTDYSPDYFEKILETFAVTGADIVGGPYLTTGNSNLQIAIGNAISSIFGIGGSKAHNPKFAGYVDSVPYGAYRRSIFDDIGLFDERFIRDQDDEFNYRANQAGKKVYLTPEIKLWYHPRSSLSALFRQYYGYGIFKPMVLVKVTSGVKLRHIIPLLFFLYILSLPLIAYFTLWLFPLLIYILLDIGFSFFSQDSTARKLISLLIYPVLHISYGAGFLSGLFKLKSFQQTKHEK